MPVSKLNIEPFLESARNIPILDVRSPSEFEHAHIPGAISFPIFSDEERKKIGTEYKQIDRATAIKTGLDAFGKNLVNMVVEAEKIASANNTKEFGVHCWRGGMRSAAMAWLLDLYGFKVFLLNGGYKAYRNWVLQQFEKKYNLRILGGYTGGNKTGIIHQLIKLNEPVIDLEHLAGHMGSAFGNLNQVKQPGQEQFENLLAEELIKYDADAQIWLEGESQRIGMVNIPPSFYKIMRQSPVLFLDIPFQQRLDHIIKTYGHYDKEKLVNAIIRIQKRLGGLETKNAVNALLENDITTSFSILLKYYDKQYLKSTYHKEDSERSITRIECPTTEATSNTKHILNYVLNQHH
jgi:tRNA 2-selenouridine synthase